MKQILKQDAQIERQHNETSSSSNLAQTPDENKIENCDCQEQFVLSSIQQAIAILEKLELQVGQQIIKLLLFYI